MFRMGRATEQDATDIQRLRLEAYRAAPEFQLSDEGCVAWGREDAEGVVLAVWHEGVVVSTTRGNLLRDRAEAEQFLKCDLSDIPLRYPALALSKGATSAQFGRHGLHSMLRYAFIHAARDYGLASVTGVLWEGAPRSRLMRRVGYEYFTPKRQWLPVSRVNTKTLVARLPSDSFAMALSTLVQEIDVTCVPESLCKEIALWIGGRGSPNPPNRSHL
jgi:hypothetical protein